MYNEQKFGAARKIVYLLFLLGAIALVFTVGKMIISRLNGDMSLITANDDICDNEEALAELNRNGIPTPRACETEQ